MTPFNVVYQTGDDEKLVAAIGDVSGGMNNRFYGADIAGNQVTLLYNADIGVPGQSTKRPGMTLCKDLSNDYGCGALGFEPDGGTNELLVIEDTSLQGCTAPAASGSDTFTEHKANFTADKQTIMIKAGESGEGDVVLVGNGTDNWFRMNQSHTMQDLGSTAGTGNDSPPKSTVATYFRNRVWVVKSNLAYFSDAFPADYSVAFDTATNAFRMPIGTERAIVGLRDQGLILIGSDQVWGLNPSITPDPSADKPEKLLDIGCVANKTVAQVNDDVWFVAPDGLRGVFRTQQDNLQLQKSYPLSYLLKEQYDSLNWSYIHLAQGIFWDNKYFLAVPTGASTYNNEVWVFFPSNMVQAGPNIIVPAAMAITGWNVGAWAKMKYEGEERLFYVDSNDGSVYRAWYGSSDNSTAINYQEETRKNDCGDKMKKKCAGEIEIKAKASGDYDLSIYTATDDGSYSLLGTMNLAGSAPSLPQTLPFTLTGEDVARKKFPIDSLGEWTVLQLKIQHNATSGSDDITIYERNIITYPQEYYSE